MSTLSAVAAIALAGIALLHLAWAAGAAWPAADAAALARLVYGRPGPPEMPPAAATVAAAGAMFVGAWLLLAGGGVAQWPLPSAALAALLGLMAAVFAARGLATYAFGSPWRLFGAQPEEPFATQDRKLYAPICLAFAYAAGTLALHAAQDFGASPPS
ncbi:MAG: DUF3995 domain-containing protein [Pseudomonadota bacterium]